MAASVDEAMEQFKHGSWHGVYDPEKMKGLSQQCKKGVEADEKRRKEQINPSTDCPRHPCVGRMDIKSKSRGKVQHAEGPVCLPKECQNAADVKVISVDFQEAMDEMLGKHGIV